MEMPSQTVLAAARNALLTALPDVQAIYVYGSFARGEQRPGSDLDLAILLPAGRRMPDLLDLMARIAAEVHREVDLVELGTAGDVLRRQVLDSGQLLYAAQPEQLLAWEASAMSRYARYREEVRDILADFQHTGVGYAQ